MWRVMWVGSQNKRGVCWLASGCKERERESSAVALKHLWEVWRRVELFLAIFVSAPSSVSHAFPAAAQDARKVSFASRKNSGLISGLCRRQAAPGRHCCGKFSLEASAQEVREQGGILRGWDARKASTKLLSWARDWDSYVCVDRIPTSTCGAQRGQNFVKLEESPNLLWRAQLWRRSELIKEPISLRRTGLIKFVIWLTWRLSNLIFVLSVTRFYVGSDFELNLSCTCKIGQVASIQRGLRFI